MALPEKFELEYMDKDGQLKRPIMIHRALFGSVERFIGILIEHFIGKFPLWLSPSQVRVIPIADRHELYANQVCSIIKQAGFQSDVDASHESVNKKVRNAQLMQYNYILILGDKELENQSINLRTRDNVVHGELALNVFLHKIEQERSDYSLTSYFAEEVNA
jgi:threonyl-tRNA synthetase